MSRRDVTVRAYLINKYGVKPNGEPDVDWDELMKKADPNSKTIDLEIIPYPEEMVRNAEEIDGIPRRAKSRQPLISRLWESLFKAVRNMFRSNCNGR